MNFVQSGLSTNNITFVSDSQKNAGQPANNADDNSGISIFAKLDKNKNNTIEKEETGDRITDGLKNNASTVFNNILASITGQDAVAIKERAQSLKDSISLQSFYDKAISSFSGINVGVNKVKEDADKESIKKAQKALDAKVENQIEETIKEYNNTATQQYTDEVQSHIQQITEEVQQERIENTFATEDKDNNHIVTYSEVSYKGLDLNTGVQELLSKFDTSDLKNVSVNINNLLDNVMKLSVLQFNDVDAQMTVPENNEEFNNRVSINVERELDGVQNYYNSQIRDVEFMINQEIQQSITTTTTTTTKPGDMQKKNKEQIHATKSSFEEQGAVIKHETINGQHVQTATYLDGNDKTKKVVINANGSTTDIVNSSGHNNTTKEVIDAQSHAINHFEQQSNVHNLNIKNPSAKGQNIVGTYQDSNNKNHEVIFTPTFSPGSSDIKIRDNIRGDNENAMHTSVYNLVKTRTGISRDMLESLNITPELKGKDIVYKNKQGNYISQTQLVHMFKQNS